MMSIQGGVMQKTENVFMFTRNGMGEAPVELQQMLAKKFLALVLESGQIPARILFYTEGVKLACRGSVVLDELTALEEKGTELVLCQTCLDYLGLSQYVKVGMVGGMGDIIETMNNAPKVISL
jgi:sulfur relay (sulfurtransferase) complex TusBCD TusD component (DsrE family)